MITNDAYTTATPRAYNQTPPALRYTAMPQMPNAICPALCTRLIGKRPNTTGVLADDEHPTGSCGVTSAGMNPAMPTSKNTAPKTSV